MNVEKGIEHTFSFGENLFVCKYEQMEDQRQFGFEDVQAMVGDIVEAGECAIERQDGDALVVENQLTQFLTEQQNLG